MSSRKRVAMPQEHQAWLDAYLARKGWSGDLDTPQHKSMRNAYRQMLLKLKTSGAAVDGDAVLELLRKLPKRLKADATLSTTLNKLLGLLNIDDELYPRPELRATGHIYNGHEVRAIRLCEKTIWLQYVIDGHDGLFEARVPMKQYCDTLEGLNGCEYKTLFGSRDAYDAFERLKEEALSHGLVGDADYELLGVELGVSATGIKAAYKRLANVHHPDKGGDSDYMAELTVARDRLLASIY